MVTNINQTHCGDHFAIYTNIKALCRKHETNIMSYVNYTSLKKRPNQALLYKKQKTKKTKGKAAQVP